MKIEKTNPGDPEVELHDADLTHTPRPFLDEQQKKMGLVAVRLAALCRLQYLDDFFQRQQRSAIVVPDNTDMRREFERLQHWWRQMGREKQDKLMLLAEEMAKQVLLIEAGGLGL